MDDTMKMIGEIGTIGVCFSERYDAPRTINPGDSLPSRLMSSWVHSLVTDIGRWLPRDLSPLVIEYGIELRLLIMNFRNCSSTICKSDLSNDHLTFGCRLNVSSGHFDIRVQYNLKPMEYFRPTDGEIRMDTRDSPLFMLQMLDLSSKNEWDWITLAETDTPPIDRNIAKHEIVLRAIQEHTIILRAQKTSPDSDCLANNDDAFSEREWFDMKNYDTLGERRWSHDTHLRIYRRVPFVMVPPRPLQDLFSARFPSESERRAVPVSQLVLQAPRPVLNENGQTIHWPYNTRTSNRILHFDLHTRITLQSF
jgi:hypothetical protein